MTTAECIHALFKGADAHGTYGATQQSGPKVEIRGSARTVAKPATPELWQQHIDGTRRLGIPPICEDGTCVWAAIDIDDYTIDHGKLVQTLQQNGIKALVCRTKSGGAHVFVFFKEPVSADIVIPKLRDMAVLLGRGTAEVFPRQEQIDTANGKFGNWLNMPYFGGDDSSQFCVRADARGLSLGQFLSAAELNKMTQSEFTSLRLTKEVPEFSDGPPCLEHMAGARLFTAGTRNNSLMALTTFAKRLTPDTWMDTVARWNVELLDPPAPHEELSKLLKRWSQKDYNYKCGDMPLNTHCNSKLCRLRKHGVGDGGGDADFAKSLRIVTSDPKIFYLTVEAGFKLFEVRLRVEQLLSLDQLQLCAFEQHQLVLPDVTRLVWRKSLQRVTADAIIEQAPPDSGVEDKFDELLESFVTARYQAENRDELLMHKPFHDVDRKVVLFLLAALEQHLEREKFSTGRPPWETRQWVSEKLKKRWKGDNKQMKVKGSNKSVWIVSDAGFNWTNTKALDLPPLEESPL